MAFPTSVNGQITDSVKQNDAEGSGDDAPSAETRAQAEESSKPETESKDHQD